MEGTYVGPYLIESQLGAGGMGVVYRGVDTRLGRQVALKFLPAEMGYDATIRARFQQEAITASGLDHQNICAIYDVGEAPGGYPYIVMPFYDGLTLKQLLDIGRLPVDAALELALQLTSGLGAAHAAGIVHRDVKPANVIVTESGASKLLDFGVAKLSQNTGLTRTGSSIGTIAYMSPEQAKGQPVDQRADFWAVGVVLFEMLTGRRPFDGDHETAVLYQLLNQDVPSLVGVIPDISGRLEQIVKDCLVKDPDSRIGNAEELEHRLLEIRVSFGSDHGPSLVQIVRDPSLLAGLGGVSAGDDALTEDATVVEEEEPTIEIDLSTGDDTPGFDLAGTDSEAFDTFEGASSKEMDEGDAELDVSQPIGDEFVVAETLEASPVESIESSSAGVLRESASNSVSGGGHSRWIRVAGLAVILLSFWFIWQRETGTTNPEQPALANADSVEQEFPIQPPSQVGETDTQKGTAAAGQSLTERTPESGSQVAEVTSDSMEDTSMTQGGSTDGEQQNDDGESSVNRRSAVKVERPDFFDVGLPGLTSDVPPDFEESASVDIPQINAATVENATPEEVIEELQPGLVAIPAGTFTMGRDDGPNPNESPAHFVRLTSNIWMSRFEVTVEQFREFVESTGYETVAERNGGSYDGRSSTRRRNINWRDPGFEQSLNHPVVHVTREDAIAFATWMGGRLPTEAEWEYAARAGSNDNVMPDPNKHAWNAFQVGLSPRTRPAGRKTPNAWGLYDMQGNVWELVSDYYSEEYYSTSPEVNPTGPNEGNATIRGGGWTSDPLSLTARNRVGQNYSGPDIGFRVVFDR